MLSNIQCWWTAAFLSAGYIPWRCDKHGEENAASIARADNMPPNFKACRYCAQQFGSSSLSIHEQRCRQRPELAAEHELHDLLVKHSLSWHAAVLLAAHGLRRPRACARRPSGASRYCTTAPAHVADAHCV